MKPLTKRKKAKVMKHIRLIIFVGIILIYSGCGTAGKSFNTSSIESIANGSTTRSDIKKMFGKPFKTGIQNGQPIWIYENHHYSIIGKNASKDLIIIFGLDGIVQSHQFMSNEPAL